MESIYLFGISTTSKRIKSFIEYHNLYKIEGFFVDDIYCEKDSYFEGIPIMSLSDFQNFKSYQNLPVFICIAWNRLNKDRRLVYEKLLKEKLNIINLISPNSIIRGKLMGSNIFVGDYVVLETNSKIYSNVFVDHHAFIGTNTIVKSHAYVCARSMIAGNVIIGEQSFIGINSTVFDEVQVGEQCIISGGEVVKRNVPDFSVIKKKNNEQVVVTYDADEVQNKLIAQKNVR